MTAVRYLTNTEHPSEHYSFLASLIYYILINFAGKLSIVSQSGGGIQTMRSVGGLSFHEYAIQIMQINMNLHFSRGLAEHIFVTDLNEFFIPRGKYWNFLDLLKAIEPKVDPSVHANKGSKIIDIWSENKATDSSHGWADGHAHPPCYISIDIEYVVNPQQRGYFDKGHPWFGER